MPVPIHGDITQVNPISVSRCGEYAGESHLSVQMWWQYASESYVSVQTWWHNMQVNPVSVSRHGDIICRCRFRCRGLVNVNENMALQLGTLVIIIVLW